jgi:hypothetical protein
MNLIEYPLHPFNPLTKLLLVPARPGYEIRAEYEERSREKQLELFPCAGVGELPRNSAGREIKFRESGNL